MTISTAMAEGKSNIFDAISIQKKMMQVTGIWPQKTKSSWYRFRQCFSWCMDLSFGCLLCLEVISNMKIAEYKKVTELLSLFASDVSYVAKHFFFWQQSDKFIDTIEKLNRTPFTNYPMFSDTHLRSSIKYARLMMRGYQTLVASLIVIYLLKPFFTKDDTAVNMDMFDFGKYTFFFHLYQVFNIGLGCWNNSSLDCLALGLISIGTAQFSILRDKLLNLREWAGFTYSEVDSGKRNPSTEFDPSVDWHVNQRLKECVIHHINIIEYVEEIETIYSYYFLAQFSNSVMAICNTWFQFQLAEDWLNIVFLVFYTSALLTQLGIYCLYGNNLMLKSEEIRDACYMSQWYKCDVRSRKTLMLLMERSKRPSILTAGKFTALGLAAFSNLLQTSYSYFALMDRLNGN